MDEVDGRDARADRPIAEPPADDEARAAADRRPGIGQLTAGDRGRQVERQAVDDGLGLAELAVRDGGTLRPQVDDGLDARAAGRSGAGGCRRCRRASERREAGGRDRDGQVESGLVRGDVEELLVERPVDEHVRPDAEEDRRRRHERDEGEGQAGPDTAETMHRGQRTALYPRRGP